MSDATDTPVVSTETTRKKKKEKTQTSTPQVVPAITQEQLQQVQSLQLQEAINIVEQEKRKNEAIMKACHDEIQVVLEKYGMQLANVLVTPAQYSVQIVKKNNNKGLSV